MAVSRSAHFLNYFSLVKINHTIFSLPFALIGFSLALKTREENFNFRLLLLVLLCVFFARNAAMGFNRYADREFDRKNPRTALREIPNSIIRPTSALIFVILNALLFILTTWFLNPLCFFLSPVALLVVLGYSLTKRFTALSHFFLGMGLALAPIGAYLAVTAHFDILPLIYSFIVIFWVAGFDILYALQDIDFDQSEQLKSLPAFLGKRNALILSALFHLIAVFLVTLAGFTGSFHLLYWLGTILFTLVLSYEHLIVKPRDISRVNLAFATLNGMASVIFACFVIADLVFSH
ncbi:MAG: putative 4-hydroxybenzoate polyprenyltransferase [Bacteroidales bacterium]|jgi:4-hydroxybenzoate polyprenyltransferase|nr:putative 4-hydroxybenzoate polyprenyltransferase [Bacteroidales bacterium]